MGKSSAVPEITFVSAHPAKDFHVVYSPFAAPKNPNVRKLGTSWEPHDDKYIVVRHGDDPKALGWVKDGQTVYVVGHCAELATTLSDNEGRELTAEQLAKQMKADGLPLAIRRIKLYACSGGAGGHWSFASQLGAWLKDQGFHSFELFAYTTTVYSLDPKSGHKLANSLDSNGHEDANHRVPASSMRIQVV